MESRSFKATSQAHHYLIEVFSCDVSILVEICFLENLVNFLVSQSLAQLFSNALKFLSCDFSLYRFMITFFWKSKDLKTLSISSWVRVYPIFPVANFRKVSKVNPPAPSVSRSLRILKTNLLLAANPRLTKAFFSSTGSTTPLPSLSKMSKAVLISLTS